MSGSPTEMLAGARRSLAGARRAGADTAAARAEIARLEQQVAHEAAQAAATRARQEQARSHELQHEIGKLAAERLASMMAALEKITSVAAVPTQVDHILAQEHRSAVAAHLRARHGLGIAAARLDVQDSEANDLRDRIADLDHRRAEMADRRRRGDTRPEDAGDLALVDMDRAGLAEPQQAAQQAAGEAGQAADRASEAFAAADRAVDAFEAKLVATTLLGVVRHADSLAVAANAVLGNHLAKLNAAGESDTLATSVEAANVLNARLLLALATPKALTIQAGAAGRPPWGASRELLQELRDVAVRRGEL